MNLTTYADETATTRWEIASMTFVRGHTYTRDQIHDQLGGELVTYLPQKRGEIVCGCFTQDLGPLIPAEVLVGTGPEVQEKARLLRDQKGAIPIFCKLGAGEWEYLGLYRCCGYTEESLVLQDRASRSGRKNLKGVLWLERELVHSDDDDT